jgi:flagellum-specific peptidoglycan hydrolase FlgJ
MVPQVFFKMYAPYAINTQIIDGVPASITLAQAALESAWGESGLTKQANNFFGIKDQKNDEYYGAYVPRDTTEYINGSPTTVTANFRKYSTPQRSFNDHAIFLKANKRYNSLFSLAVTDYIKWAQGLQAAGYATDPTYASKLVNLVVKYNLTQYDQAAVVKKKSLLPPSL